MEPRLLAALARGPLLLDAAMGTRLIARGLILGDDDPALWNLARPEIVADLHRRDVGAGSDALVTNTFGANRTWLSRFGRSGAVGALNRAAVMLARSAAGPDRLVLGGLGPTAVHSPEAYREQAEILADAGVDAFFLETHDANAALLGLNLLRDVASELPRLVGLFQSDPLPPGLAPRLVDAGATALGGNCQAGMGAALALIEAPRKETGVPLLAKPSGGLPGGPVASPESFAAAVPALLAAGVCLFGGCCGTTEAHVAALRVALDAVASHRRADRV